MDHAVDEHFTLENILKITDHEVRFDKLETIMKELSTLKP